jgi:hypothetical protein
MGYYVEGEGSIVIKAANVEAAYKAMVALNNVPDELKRGGTYSNGAYVSKHFSWMPTDLTEIKTAEEMFERLGFHYSSESDGFLELTAYDSKMGQEEIFVAAVQQFVEDDSHFEWKGEDGSMWTWKFNGGKLFKATAMVEWQDEGALSLGAALGLSEDWVSTP